MLEEGNFMISAKGQFKDFDFAPREFRGGQAFAGNVGDVGVVSSVLDMVKIDEQNLRIESTTGTYVLVDPVGDSSIKDFYIKQV